MKVKERYCFARFHLLKFLNDFGEEKIDNDMIIELWSLSPRFEPELIGFRNVLNDEKIMGSVTYAKELIPYLERSYGQ